MSSKGMRTCSSPKLVTLQSLIQQIRKQRPSGSSLQWTSWIRTTQADCFFGVAIALHAAVIGLDIELQRLADTSGDLHSVVVVGLMIVRSFLLLIFSTELFLRVMAFGRAFLFSINGCFDVFLVLTGWTDIILAMDSTWATVEVSAAMHACRLLRLVRIFRIFSIVPALRRICAGLMDTAVASLWAVCLLLLLAYVGSLLCTDVLGETLTDLYGSVGLSILTHVKLALVEAWPDIAAPMMDHSRMWALYLTAFMLVCNMALLNVVTGLICEKVMVIAHKTPPPSLQEREEAALDFEEKLWRMFCSADVDNNSTLCETEYLDLLKTWDMQEFLQDAGIGLPLDHIHVLTVLDKDNNGHVTFEEFHDGLRRQRGTRTDHQSQSLQYDLAERTNQIVAAVRGARHGLKASVRRSVRRARRRLLRRLDQSAQECCVASGPPVKDPGSQGDLLGLEEASAELRSRLSGLRAACFGARDAAELRAPPLALAVEDIRLEDWSQSPILCEASSEWKAKCHAGTGSIGGHSSGSGSSRRQAAATSCNRSNSRSSSSSSSSSSSGSSRSSRSSRSRALALPASGLKPLGAAPVGTLHVQVLGVHGLRTTGEVPFNGSFDTYVTLRIGSLECRTPTACYNMGAAWAFGEVQVFDLAGAPPAPPEPPPALQAEVMNAWLISADSLGAVHVGLEGLEPGRWHRRRGRLLGGRQEGELELALRWWPEAYDPEAGAGERQEGREEDAGGGSSSGPQPDEARPKRRDAAAEPVQGLDEAGPTLARPGRRGAVVGLAAGVDEGCVLPCGGP